MRDNFFVREVSKAQVILCVLPSILEQYDGKSIRRICSLGFKRVLPF